MRDVWIARLCVHASSLHPSLTKKTELLFPVFSFVEGSRVGCGYT